MYVCANNKFVVVKFFHRIKFNYSYSLITVGGKILVIKKFIGSTEKNW